MSLFYNVKGASVSGRKITTELVAPNLEYNVRSLLLTNVHDSVAATVTLFIQNDPTDTATNTYEIIHGVVIPVGAALAFEQPIIFKVPEAYGLYIKVGSNDLIDVTVNT